MAGGNKFEGWSGGATGDTDSRQNVEELTQLIDELMGQVEYLKQTVSERDRKIADLRAELTGLNEVAPAETSLGDSTGSAADVETDEVDPDVIFDGVSREDFFASIMPDTDNRESQSVAEEAPIDNPVRSGDEATETTEMVRVADTEIISPELTRVTLAKNSQELIDEATKNNVANAVKSLERGDIDQQITALIMIGDAVGAKALHDKAYPDRLWEDPNHPNDRRRIWANRLLKNANGRPVINAAELSQGQMAIAKVARPIGPVGGVVRRDEASPSQDNEGRIATVDDGATVDLPDGDTRDNHSNIRRPRRRQLSAGITAAALAATIFTGAVVGSVVRTTPAAASTESMARRADSDGGSGDDEIQQALDQVMDVVQDAAEEESIGFELRQYDAGSLPAKDHHKWGIDNGDGTYNLGHKVSSTAFSEPVNTSSHEAMYNDLMEAIESMPEQASIFASQLASQEQLSVWGFDGDLNKFADAINSNDELCADVLNYLSQALGRGDNQLCILDAGIYSNYGISRMDDGSFELLSSVMAYGQNDKTIVSISYDNHMLYFDPACGNVYIGVDSQAAVAENSVTTDVSTVPTNAPTGAVAMAGDTDVHGQETSPDAPVQEVVEDTDDVVEDHGGGGGDDRVTTVPKAESHVNNQNANVSVVINHDRGSVDNPTGVTEVETPGGSVVDAGVGNESGESGAGAITEPTNQVVVETPVGNVSVDADRVNHDGTISNAEVSTGGVTHEEAVSEAVKAAGTDASGAQVSVMDQGINYGRVEL